MDKGPGRDEGEDESAPKIKGYFAQVIREFRRGLEAWLNNDNENSDGEDIEDRELDSLLLKVTLSLSIPYQSAVGSQLM
jgi:hypothetical protein